MGKTYNKSRVVEVLTQLAGAYEYLSDKRRTTAYRNALRSIISYSGSFAGITDFTFMNGVGASINEKIVEIVKTGKCKKLDELASLCPPPTIVEFQQLRSVGPVGAKKIWQTYNVTTLKELQELANNEKINDADLVAALAFHAKEQERLPLYKAIPLVESITHILKARGIALPAGSIRRQRDTVGDIDILTTVPVSDAIKLLRREFVIANVEAEGTKKAHIFFEDPPNMQVDIIHSDAENYGAALLYLTGSKDFNIAMRRIAIQQGWKLSQYGLKSRLSSKTYHTSDEFKIFQKLGLEYVSPELREDEEFLDKKTPTLLTNDDIKTDLHCHTKWSDGTLSIEALARMGIRDGLHQIGICDHTRAMAIAGGLTAQQLLKQAEAVEQARKGYEDHVDILHGAEVDIHTDGTLDLPDDILNRLDFAIGAIHARPETNVEARLLAAINSGMITCIAHPSGREFGKRGVAAINWDNVFRAAAKNNVAMEINGQPTRMDLPVDLIKHAKKRGVKFLLGSDCHGASRSIVYALANARKAALTKNDLYDVEYKVQ